MSCPSPAAQREVEREVCREVVAVDRAVPLTPDLAIASELMPRTDRASRSVDAPVARVFHALIDPQDLLAWLPHGGMTATFERFDPRPGGSYRLILTYDDPTGTPGKSTADSDIVEVRYLDIVPDARVVQAVDFVSDDPAFAGTMTMTWEVRAAEGGTLVEIIADDVPDGISAEDHATGLASSLENLARHLGS